MLSECITGGVKEEAAQKRRADLRSMDLPRDGIPVNLSLTLHVATCRNPSSHFFLFVSWRSHLLTNPMCSRVLVPMRMALGNMTEVSGNDCRVTGIASISSAVTRCDKPCFSCHPRLDEGLIGVFNRGGTGYFLWSCESRFRWNTAREGVEGHQVSWNTAREGVECHHHFGHWPVRRTAGSLCLRGLRGRD